MSLGMCHESKGARLFKSMKVIWLILSLAVPAIAAPPAQPITLTAGPHLFVDDYLISHQEHLERVLNQPVRLPAPIVTSAEDKNFQPYVSVVRDPQTRRFRMWYDAPADPPKIEPSRLAYLESDDGIAWLRPHRLLENPGGIEIRFGASVFDEGPAFRDPTKRFKLGWNVGKFTDAAPGGLMVATSPDGFAWTPVPGKPPVLAHDHDINNIFFDPIRKRYLATVSNMVPPPNGQGKRRQPFQSTSDDLVHWSEPWPVIVPDAQDEGEFQYYAMSGYLARGDLLIGLAKILRDDLPADPGGKVAGIGYTVLTWTRDGRTWQRERAPFLDRNPAPGTWDHAMTWIDCQLLAGDELLLYYGGYARGHKIERFAERQIGLARMPRDRYVARRAGAEQGTLRTPMVQLDAAALTVNANVEGELRVRILDDKGHAITGFDFADGTPIRGDAVAHPVRWKEPLETLRGRAVQLEFSLTKAQLYSFDLGAAVPGQ